MGILYANFLLILQYKKYSINNGGQPPLTLTNKTSRVMTQKELLAKCTERDQAFYDFFHKKLDIKAFTELIDPEQVPYISLVDYHMVVNRHGEVFHTFMLEARTMDDARNFFFYLRDEVIEPGTIANYSIGQVSDTAFGYYQLTLTIA